MLSYLHAGNKVSYNLKIWRKINERIFNSRRNIIRVKGAQELDLFKDKAERQ